MILLNDYLGAPCRLSSLPYWKQKNREVPDNIKIVHNSEYNAADFVGYKDEPYFRLYHDLKTVRQPKREDIDIIIGTAEMLNIFVDIINKSYSDLSVTKEQMESYRKTPVFSPDLWILLKDATGAFVGCGIADHDKEIGEMILEWIQVLPFYRGRGYGQCIVNYLLAKAQGRAKFATVSGKVNNATNPEKLYRKCGFMGNDVWHILYKRET